MPFCIECNQEFTYTVYINDQKHELKRTRKKCTDCQPLLKRSRSVERIVLYCLFCGKEFSEYESRLRNPKGNSGKYCSKKCFLESDSFKKGVNSKIFTSCGFCSKEIKAYIKRIENSKCGKVFCNASCRTKYTNSHRPKGHMVSKLELYIQEKLKDLYPNIYFLFNDRSTINSELDIYLPHYKLAFELNGVFHYEPILGKDYLLKIQNNDQRKFQACLEQDIELVTIDSTGLKYFKKDNSDKYLKIVTDIIDKKLNFLS